MITDLILYLLGAVLFPLALQLPMARHNANAKVMIIKFVVLDVVLSVIMLVVTAALISVDLATLATYIVSVLIIYGGGMTTALHLITKKYNVTCKRIFILLPQLYTVALLANQIVRVVLAYT